jgi:hypothetical protein
MRKKIPLDESEMREFLSSLGIPEEVIERFISMADKKPVLIIRILELEDEETPDPDKEEIDKELSLEKKSKKRGRK